MKIETWIKKNTASLQGKTVAITGATGGLGNALCRQWARLGADLILLDRNQTRSAALEQNLRTEFPAVEIRRIPLDLEDLQMAENAACALNEAGIDVFIHNAGAYSIPRHLCASGYENVFQINFATPYYLIQRILPMLRERKGRVVAVGSIAHRYSKTDTKDLDFRTRRAASKVYGNAKRYLMVSLDLLFEKEQEASLSIVHPGITFTNITAHYPKWIFAIIKNPMKIIFMKPAKAALCILRGVFEPTASKEWIGPWLFDIWGRPQKSKLRSISSQERKQIALTAEQVYQQCKKILSP
jgi:NAD(P)-dependent dehydrogenase (short-subunit alcohol dehydrogenase family)